MKRMMQRRTGRSVVALLVVVAGVAAGCGGSDRDSGGARVEPVPADAPVLSVEATSFSFTPKTITVNAGQPYGLALHSENGIHDFVVDKGVGEIASANSGQTVTRLLKVPKPGTYTFYCSIPGHRAAGMEGTLIVN